MRPRNREVNIFNMSVLDLLTGALGAFCFLTLALFPYYFKAQNASAGETSAHRLKTEHQKLVEQLARIKSGGRGMPPFAMAVFFTRNDAGQPCGGIQFKDAQAPGGRKSIKQFPAGASGLQGYTKQIFLFMFAPGAYQLGVTALAGSLPCHLALMQFGPGSSPSGALNLTRSIAPYPWKFDVTSGQIIAEQFAGR
ncbi:MAG: hypothetical protein ACREP6_13090 [Candidatus Binataceae bacterium]